MIQIQIKSLAHKISITYPQEHKQCIALTPQTKAWDHRSIYKYSRHIWEAQYEANAWYSNAMQVNVTSSIQKPKRRTKTQDQVCKTEKKRLVYKMIYCTKWYKNQQTNSNSEANTKLSPQTSKGDLVQRFGEDIGYLVLGSNMLKLDIFFFSWWSLRKWYLTSMCLVLKWSTIFLATLSKRRGTQEKFKPKSRKV